MDKTIPLVAALYCDSFALYYVYVQRPGIKYHCAKVYAFTIQKYKKKNYIQTVIIKNNI